MSVPNYIADVHDLRQRYPAEWSAAHRKGPGTNDFVRRLAWVLHQRDPKVGLNGKRGNPNDLSDDCICYRASGKSRDVRTGESVAVIDFITAAPNQPSDPDGTPGWGEVWDPANIPTAATWVQPMPVGDTVPGPTPTLPPTPAPAPTPGVDLRPVLDKLAGIEAVIIGLSVALQRIEAALDAVVDEQETQRAELAAAVEAARQARNLAQNLSDRLENGLAVEVRVPTFGGTARGTVKG